ncbi:MAG TPA: hypothetical protein VE078_08965 [Thermoanaerobaculia bacterium]|nr:hypothetical protein [Thermoanaerobaculia bacterium]
MADQKTTTDHEAIRRWAEERGGRPALALEQQDQPLGLRIEFPEDREGADELLRLISWDEFFQKFDEDNLVFLYRDEHWVF